MYRKLLGSYFGIVSVFVMTVGGYVACGAQNYRVAVDRDTDRRVPSTGGEAAHTAADLPSGTHLTGVHSSLGWEKHLPIVYQVSSDFSKEQATQLQLAMKTWEIAVGKGLFRFEGMEKRRGADFSSLYAPLDDNVNSHYYDFTWAKSTGKHTSVLATTIWENDPTDVRAIAKCDIRYNIQHYRFGDTLNDQSEGDRTVVDLQSLALHELGHLLGLSHISAEEDRYSVMNPALFIGEGMITRRLSRGDIERVRSVYVNGDSSLAEKLEKADDFSE